MATRRNEAEPNARFRRLNQIFWLAWVGLAVMVYLLYERLSSPAELAAQLPPDQAQCVQLMPNPAVMSAEGKALFWGLFAMQIAIYVILLGALHLIVHRLARGSIFVAETLSTVHWLGVVLIVWPFLDTLTQHLVAGRLKAIGDLPIAAPSYAIDVAPIAVGLFLIALRQVLERAIALKSDHDLTI